MRFFPVGEPRRAGVATRTIARRGERELEPVELEPVNLFAARERNPRASII